MEISSMTSNGIKNIKASYVRLYLEKSGWKEVFFKKKRYYDSFQNTKNNMLFQINIPTDLEIDDYNEMIQDACLKISSFEGIAFDETITRLLNPQADILKVRTVGDTALNGSLPFDDAINLFENSKKLIADAAMDMLYRTKYRTSRYPKEVDEFVSRCKFGQTEYGSYIISIICPFDNINDKNQEQLLLLPNTNPDDFIARKVTKKIIKSVKAISNAIDNNEDLSSFLEMNNEDFISLNFMEDLGNIGFSDNGNSIQIKAEWDPLSKPNSSEEPIIDFSSEKKKSLENLVVSMKNKVVEEENDTIFGYVSNANAEPILQQRVDGEITIKQIRTNCTFKAILAKKDYDAALAAHKEGKLVKVSGLIQKGRINNPVFEVIKSDKKI